eukprot:gene9021-biopygen9223
MVPQAPPLWRKWRTWRNCGAAGAAIGVSGETSVATHVLRHPELRVRVRVRFTSGPRPLPF